MSSEEAATSEDLGPSEDVRLAAHVFVADINAPTLDDGDRHHLRRVLRIGAGETVTVADGAGRWRPCRLDGSAGGLAPVGDVQIVARESPMVTIAFAPTKGERPEWAVQKLTEIGVDRIIVFMAARSVVRWSGERAVGALARLNRVAHEAAMQSRRLWLPEVEFAESLAQAAGAQAAGAGADGVTDRAVGAAMAEFGGAPPSLDHPWLLVGPEGGWDQAEQEWDLPRISLGPRVLRAETATVAAATILCGLRSGLVRPG